MLLLGITITTSWAALVLNSLFGWSLQRLYQILLESVLDVPRKLPLKFHQNRVSNSRDINDIEFLLGVVVVVCKVIFVSNPT